MTESKELGIIKRVLREADTLTGRQFAVAKMDDFTRKHLRAWVDHYCYGDFDPDKVFAIMAREYEADPAYYDNAGWGRLEAQVRDEIDANGRYDDGDVTEAITPTGAVPSGFYCTACGRDVDPWPVKRPNGCSPADWVYCIRQIDDPKVKPK